MSLYSAGGCIAAVNGGFLNTPTGDYSGEFRMTCRLKLVKGQKLTNSDLDIILLRRSALIDYKRVTIKLTEEWQDVEFLADNGWFEDCMIQFFTMENFSYLIDDVKIQHVINSIMPPTANPAINIGNDSFTATWLPTESSDEYLLSVYSYTDNSDSDQCKEGFEGISQTGGVINGAKPNYPEGWEFNLAEGKVYTESGWSEDGNQAIRLGKNGDFVQTPRLKYPVKNVKFWARGDARDGQKVGGNAPLITVYALTDYGWTRWTQTSVNGLIDLNFGTTLDMSQYVEALENIYQIKIVLEKDDDDNSAVAIDNVELYAPGTPLRSYFFEDKVIPKTPNVESESYEVKGLDPDVDYYYYLKARNSEYTSSESREIEAYTVHTPVALPATEVTETSYVANWSCGKKADKFQVDQMLSYTATADEADYVVLDEDFSKVKSTGSAESPEVGEYTTDFVSLDKYTKISGWTATSYSKGDGMIGGLSQQSPYIAGSIVTPVLKLSNNGGVCIVSGRVYGEKQDFIVIQGVNEAAFNSVYFENTGFVDFSVELPYCVENEQITFYSNNYKPFMIDNIKITQPLKAGETSSIVNRSITVDDAALRSLKIDNTEFTDGYDLQYRVSATRYYHGNVKDPWTSAASNAVTVTKPGAVAKVESGSLVVTVADGGINITLPESSMIEVYDISGRLVAKQAGVAGTNRISISGNGIYIVRAAGRNVKVCL